MLTLAFAPGGEDADRGLFGLGVAFKIEARERVAGLCGDGFGGLSSERGLKGRPVVALWGRSRCRMRRLWRCSGLGSRTNNGSELDIPSK